MPRVGDRGSNKKQKTMNSELIQKLEELIREKASAETCHDSSGEDFNPADFGQYDDCFDAGLEDGGVYFARLLLELIDGENQND